MSKDLCVGGCACVGGCVYVWEVCVEGLRVRGFVWRGCVWGKVVCEGLCMLVCVWEVGGGRRERDTHQSMPIKYL